MKKFVFPALLFALSLSRATGQTLYQAVYEKAKSIVENPASTTEEKAANRFKLEALNYISRQATGGGASRDSYFFDSQAVNLTSFIEDFLTNTQTAGKTSKAKADEMARCYTSAASKFPLFSNGPEADRQPAPEAALPFPINTDWEKAYDSATSSAKVLLRKK